MRPAAVSVRLVAGLTLSLVAGLVIGHMDSRPGFDDTGVTAVSLVLAAGLAAFIAGRAPWLVAITTGIWVAVFELATVRSGGPIAALVLACVGATIGWLLARR